MKWLKNRYYLFLFLIAGIVYLSCVDAWQVYAAPWEQIKNRIRGEAPLPEDKAENPEGEGKSPEEGKQGEEPSAGGVLDGNGAGEEETPEETTEGAGESTGSEETPGEGGESPAEENPPEEEGGGEAVYMTVEDDYFADALFIGDSRTVGLFEYGGLEEITTFYASKGLTVYKMFDSPIVSVPEQKNKITIEEALQSNTFAKIYLMIGINEMGTGTVDSFMEKYQEVVVHLQELQPDAIIYLQAIIKVTAERSAKGDYIFNEGIEERNERIAQLADNKKIFFLDVNPLICDDTGGMIPEYTFDGVHLKGKYIEIWKDYLKTHAIFP